MVTLLVPWYRSRSDRHNSELLGALFHNLCAPGVTRVILVSESDPPPVHHPLLEFVRSEARPTFWELFELVRDEGPFAVVNADCAVFDASFIATLLPGEALWNSRWEIRHEAPRNGRYHLAPWGADLFAFGSVPDNLPREGWAPGVLTHDTRLGAAMVKCGLRVRNLPAAVPIMHFHAERDVADDAANPGLDEFFVWHLEPSGDFPAPRWTEPVPRRDR